MEDRTAEAFWAEAEALAGAAAAALEYLAALGGTAVPAAGLPALTAPLTAPASPLRGGGRPQGDHAPRPVVRPEPRHAENTRPSPDPAGWIDEAADLAALAEAAENCRLCPLAETRRRVLFGHGGARPRVVAVGEFPEAAAEDLGRAPAGAAGELLAAILSRGLQLAPEEVYVTTTVKCRPPAGPPPPEAVAACRPLLTRQLAFLRPEMVLALGALPAQSLSGSRSPLGLLRRQTHEVVPCPGLFLRATYSLADLLAEEALKKQAWLDLQPVIAFLRKR